MVQENKRRFEYKAGSSNKYWEIWDVGTKSFTTHWGRIGTKGQQKTKDFLTSSNRNYERLELIQKKLIKGYKELKLPEAKSQFKTETKVIKPKVIEAKVKEEPKKTYDPFEDRIANLDLDD